MTAEYQRRKPKDIAVVVLPGVGRQAGFSACLLEKSDAIPVLLRRHLRQQQAFGIPIPDEQSVAPDANLPDVHHMAQRREHRDFVLQLIQFPCSHRLETLISHGGVSRNIPNRVAKRLHRPHISDASAQLSVLRQRDKRAAFLHQRIHSGRGAFVQFAFLHRRFHRLLCYFEQPPLLPRG